MTPNEQSLIEDLFARIRGNGVPNRDSDAEALIGRQMTGTPGAAYALAQTVIVQDQALRAAQARIQALEAEAQQGGANASPSSSFLGGGAQPQRQSAPQPGPWNQQQPGPPSSPLGGQPQQPDNSGGGPFGGGGFLRGAFQTAAGVAGGALLFDGIRSLFHGGGLGGGLSGLGSGFGGQPSVVEETVINNYGNDPSNDGTNVADNYDNNDPGVTDADWSDGGNDGGFDNGGDDSSWV